MNIVRIIKTMDLIENAMLKNMEETSVRWEGKPASCANGILNDAWNELNYLLIEMNIQSQDEPINIVFLPE